MTSFATHTEHSEKRVALAKKLLVAEDVHATTLIACSRIVLGPNSLIYEAETIRIGMEGHGVEMPQENYDRLFAAITLILNPVFCWDAATFAATVRAFAGEDVEPTAVEPLPPVYMGWGVIEAAAILTQEFSYEESFVRDRIDGEVLELIIGSLHEHGFAVASAGLEWAQQYLDTVVVDKDFGARVQEKWAKLSKYSVEELEDTDFEETEIGVQLARLAGCKIYCAEQKKRIGREVGALLRS